jgi:hypothetical protein
MAARTAAAPTSGDPMSAEWLTSAVLIAALTTGFGHFETVRPW